MVRILIADDHEIVRRGLRALIEEQPDLEVVAEAADGEEAVEKAIQSRPDIAVIDLSMPKRNGLEVMRQIRNAGLNIEILALTMHSSEISAYDVIAAGARGFILKTDAAKDLLTAIRALQEGKSFLSSSTSGMLLDRLQTNLAAPSPKPVLTARETEALQLLAAGKTNKEVAHCLNLSVRTVETHRANIMTKLSLHSLGEMIHYAIRNKIISH